MKLADLFSLSTRMFRTRPTRTWLTILGISVGTAAVLFLVSLGYGLQNIVLQKIVFNQALLSLAVAPGTDLIIMDDSTLEKISKIPGVENVAPMAMFTGQMSLGDINGTAEIRGVDPNYFGYAGLSTLAGSLYASGDRGKAVVSEAILKLFGIAIKEDIIGKEVKIKIFQQKTSAEGQQTVEIIDLPENFVIGGVIEDGQDSYVYIPLEQLKDSVKIEKYEQARVKAVTNKDLQPVKDEVIAMGYQTQSLSETVEQANKIFNVVQIVLGLFGAVALVVSSIGMFNTMTVTLLERTNEIGIMRTLGASKGNLRNLFLSEAIVIGFLGGIVGVLIGIIGGEIFNWLINSMAIRFGGAKTDLFLYPMWFLVIIAGLSAVIGFLSGVFPARRAASMDPLEALRYK